MTREQIERRLNELTEFVTTKCARTFEGGILIPSIISDEMMELYDALKEMDNDEETTND